MAFITSGVPRLDFIMGGGLPESFLVTIAGGPGTGKTVFIHQIAAHFAAAGRNVLYVTALSGAHASLVAQIGSFSFTDPALLGERIKFVNVFAVARQSLAAVTSTIVRTVTEDKVSLVIFDGLRTLEAMAPDARALRAFAYEMAGTLSSIRTTALFTSEADPALAPDAPEIAMADGLLATRSRWTGTRVQRTVEVVKMRGVRSVKGPHSVLVTEDGAAVFPRIEATFLPADHPPDVERLSTGTRALDEMLGGGLPRGSATLVSGLPGTGKTVLGLGFAAAGVRAGESVLLYSLHESPSGLAAKARRLELDLDGAIAEGTVRIRQADSRELDPDVVAWRLLEEIEANRVARVVVDGVGTLARAAGEERAEGFIRALMGRLGELGATTCLLETTDSGSACQVRQCTGVLSISVDNVIAMRTEETQGAMRGRLAVLKMRGSAHDHLVREYTIGAGGLDVHE